MKQVENLAHHTALINEWKKRTSCKKPKTNCFLTVSEINSHIQTAKWKYLETDTELYFVHEEENILYLYFYLPTGGKPTIEYRWNQPVMVDFVFREKETQELESETLPAWVHRGFTFYKKYQRMGYQHLTHGNTPWINADSDLCYKPAGETDLSQITDLWNKFLDKNDIILPSKTEILQQAEDESSHLLYGWQSGMRSNLCRCKWEKRSDSARSGSQRLSQKRHCLEYDGIYISSYEQKGRQNF